MGRVGTALLLVGVVGGTCRAEAPRLPRSSAVAPFEAVWQAQIPTIRSTDSPPWFTLYVSPVKTRSVYEVVQGSQRTLFTGPSAARDADIRKRVLLMSGKQATVEPRAIPVATLLAQTRGGRVEAIDAETGVRRWSAGVGVPGQSEYPAAMNDDYVVAINGFELHVIDAQSGKPIFDRVLENAPGGAPVLYGSRAYVPGVRGLFQVYELAEDNRRFAPNSMTSFGWITAPPLSTPTGVVWTTDRGSVFVGDPEQVASSYQIVGRAAVVGQPAYANAAEPVPARLFVAYENGYVTCANAKDGKNLWGFLADAAIIDGPYVAEDTVLIPTLENRLFAVDAASGKELWVAKGVSRVAGHADDVIFGESFNGSILLLDRKTGAKRGAWRLRPGEHLVKNTVSDRVYLASASGSVRCLRRPQAKWPTFYVPLGPVPTGGTETAQVTSPEAAKQPTTAEAPKSEKAETQRPVDESAPAGGEEDPFGGEDPFGDTGDPFAAGAGDPL